MSISKTIGTIVAAALVVTLTGMLAVPLVNGHCTPSYSGQQGAEAI